MVLALVIAAAIWGFGILARVPVRVRCIQIAGLWVAIVLLHLVLPTAHPLRVNLGGSAAPWLMLGAAAGLVWGYMVVLRRLRRRALTVEPAATNAPKPLFSAAELDRYARHIVLREVGGPGQKKLKEARVLVLGAGGLGAPALQYLAAAGVGTIGVIDDDVVEVSNLQRQVIHNDARIGQPKVFSARQAMLELNPHIEVLPYNRRFTADIANDLIADFDLVLDGTDNFDTRYLANRAAARAGKPLISGALSQWEGQLSVFDPAQGAPCYECIFPKAPAAGLAPSCAEAGVMGTLPGVVGAMMAGEAIKLITGAGQVMRGDMLIYDALYSETRRMKLSRRVDCPVCNVLAGKK